MSNRSLDEFVGQSASDDDDDCTTDRAVDETEANDPDDEADGTVDSAAVDPATPTYRFVPGGEACPDCGDVTEKLWYDDGDGAFVCADCKAW